MFHAHQQGHLISVVRQCATLWWALTVATEERTSDRRLGVTAL